MKHNIIFFILSALAMSSCEYELNFSGGDRNPRLFVLGMPGSSDTTVVRLHSTIPMGDRNSRPLPLDDARVILVINGEEIVMDRADETVPSLPEGSFYTLHPVQPGDKVEVRASAGGAEPVVAESTVPSLFSEHETVMEAYQWYYNYPYQLKFSARFKDDPDVADYYAMQVYLREERYLYTIDGGYEVTGYSYEYVNPIDDNEDGSGIELMPFQRPIIVNYNSGIDLYSKTDAPMVIFDDRMFENGEGIIEFIANYEKNWVDSSSWIDDVLQQETGYRYSYKIMLYHLSPELYNFIRANEILNVNLPILIGAAPPSYVYTNVRGGVGVFGGISVVETGWIPNIDPSNE